MSTSSLWFLAGAAAALVVVVSVAVIVSVGVVCKPKYGGQSAAREFRRTNVNGLEVNG